MGRAARLAAHVALVMLATLRGTWCQGNNQLADSAARRQLRQLVSVGAVAHLVELRDSIENWPAFSSANKITGWNNATPVCVWVGVTCSEEGRVQTVSLQCNNCSVPAVGQLTPTLGNMTALATVNLQGNRFYGTLPTGWGGPNQFPALQNMYLNDNNLTGTLPNEWGAAGAFPALLLIRLDSNRLSGTLPGSWGSENGGMPAMLVMRLFNNSLEGTLPVEWGRPAAFGGLNILALQINRLTGSIPEEWWTPGALPRLQELYLQTNKISGPLPDAWGRPDAFPDLTYLFLSRNPVGGTLPPEWGGNNSFPNLKVMALNDTQLTGTLPPEWGSGQGFQKLDALWLERNNLTGTIPPEWAGFDPLQRLIIRPGNPYLCGPIPPNLPFSLCDDSDVSCARVVPSLDGPNCPVLPPPSPGEVPSPPGATPPPPGATILTTRGSVKLPVDSPLIMGDVGVAGARRSSDLSRSGGTHSGTQESRQTTISGSVASPVSGAGAAGAAFAAQPPLRQQQVSPLRRRASLQPRLASAIAAASSDENVSGDRGSSTASEYWASLHDTSGVPPPTEGWSRDNSLGAVPPGAADAARQHRSGDSTGPRPSRLGGAFAFPDSPGGTQAQGPRPGWQNSGGSVGLASPFGQAMAQEQPRSPESSEYLSGSTLRSGAGGAEQPQQAEQPQRAQQQQQQQQGAQVAWGQPEETPEGYIEVLPAQSAPPPQQQQ